MVLFSRIHSDLNNEIIKFALTDVIKTVRLVRLDSFKSRLYYFRLVPVDAHS